MIPEPGDFAVSTIAGTVGRLVGLGEWLNGDDFAVYQHAFILTGYASGGYCGTIVQAEPGGATELEIRTWQAGHRRVLWSTGAIPLTAVQRIRIVTAAQGYAARRVPYSFLDYFALAAHRLHIPAPGLRDFIGDDGHMICSQLVDQCYQAAGVQLFPDGRWPGYVTPADLAGVLETQPVMTAQEGTSIG